MQNYAFISSDFRSVYVYEWYAWLRKGKLSMVSSLTQIMTYLSILCPQMNLQNI